MSTLQDAYADIRRKVRSIYAAIMLHPPTPEELARQNRACLIAAAGIRLRVAGLKPWSEGGDELAQDMADAAFEAMERAMASGLAARN